MNTLRIFVRERTAVEQVACTCVFYVRGICRIRRGIYRCARGSGVAREEAVVETRVCPCVEPYCSSGILCIIVLKGAPDGCKSVACGIYRAAGLECSIVLKMYAFKADIISGKVYRAVLVGRFARPAAYFKVFKCEVEVFWH